ncbi:MAG: hypothetical protein HC850_17845 [Rhodomicrobium sp.]|nr:hypothetical protein [Rhodomicrobium sp.]
MRGSDLKDGVNTRRLAAKGIEVAIGHRPENIEGASLVVLSSAVKEGNPELAAAKAAGLPVWSRADILARLMENYRTISVTGTHGKTTTTSMIAWIFEKAGLDPTVITGGTHQRLGHERPDRRRRLVHRRGGRVRRDLREAADAHRRRHQYRPRASRLLRLGGSDV